MTKQDFYRQEYRKIKPGWRDSLEIYRDLIDKEMTPTTRVLDIGCGHGDFLKEVYSKTPQIYGLDPDARALEKNTFIQNKVVGVVEKLPFENSVFDLVVMAWVMEHLKEPRVAFGEIYRALKPGGKVIFLTPNVWNYNVWIIRLIPEKFHDFFTRKLYGRQENDTFKKYYRVNSAKKINQTLGAVGFKKSRLIFNGDPSYISFNKILFKFACFLEKILDLKYFQRAKVHVIGVVEKE